MFLCLCSLLTKNKNKMRRRRIKFSDFYHNIIMNEVADIYNVERDRIFLGSRQKNIIFAKRLYIYTLREMFGLTLTEIASVTNLHHASVIHHHEQFKFFHEHPKNYKQDAINFRRVENKIIEVEVDEEIQGLEKKLKSIRKSLTKLYKIKQLKDEREKIKNLLTE
jgi:hypothetical protein